MPSPDSESPEESYFNDLEDGTGTHTIYPVDANPNAAAAYRGLW